jgi:hypothetical protein
MGWSGTKAMRVEKQDNCSTSCANSMAGKVHIFCSLSHPKHFSIFFLDTKLNVKAVLEAFLRRTVPVRESTIHPVICKCSGILERQRKWLLIDDLVSCFRIKRGHTIILSISIRTALVASSMKITLSGRSH